MNPNQWLMVDSGAPVAVTPGASPYTFTAPMGGMLLMSGGTVSAVSFARGATTVAPGLLAGTLLMKQGDKAAITYLVAPTLTWVPM